MNPHADIPSWLESLGLSELAPVFEENHITPDVLHDLTVDDLKEMGITSLGQRKKLLAALSKFHGQETPVTPEPAPVPVPQLRPMVPVPASVISAQPESMPEPVVPIIESAPIGKKSRRKAFSGAFLMVSISVHILLGIVAVYWVVQKIEAKRKLQFSSGPPTSAPNKRAMEHQVSLQKKKNAGGSPAQARRIAVTGLASKITLPEMPAVPTTSTQFVVGRMAGMGGAGFGSGLGFGNGSGMGIGGAGAGGLGLTMFGARGGNGLVGTFYDLKRDRDGKANGVGQDHDLYARTVRNFTTGSSWKMPSNVKCYVGKSRLVAKAFLFPAMPDTEGGKAFGEPETGPGMWIAHYSGSLRSPVSGRYRFVGWGDNLLAVRLNSQTVLDASDTYNYLGNRNISGERGSVSFPGKDNTPLLNGSWFTLTAGGMMTMDVILGDEGGIFCAGLLLEKESDNPGVGNHNIPELPVFLSGPLGQEEKRLYENHVSAKALNGPVFSSAGGAVNPLDALKR